MKGKKELLEEIMGMYRNGRKIVFATIDSKFDFNLLSEIETIIKNALTNLSEEVINKSTDMGEYLNNYDNFLESY